MKIEIIAELAQGFEGRPEQARLLVKAAAAAGADAAKLQLVYADELATPDYKHYALFRTLEMADEDWAGLAAVARNARISLQLDIFGRRSLELAQRIGVDTVKLHPTDIVNFGLLDAVVRSSVKRVLLGAGGAHRGEIIAAVDRLKGKQVVVLFGFQAYPTRIEDNHIARMQEAGHELRRLAPGAAMGFADHAAPDDPLRFALAAAAVGAGATVLEKHLTLSKVMKLEDHESALNPDEFDEFVRVIRGCAAAMGRVAPGDDFGMSEPERGYRQAIRRHVVSARPLAVGALVGPEDLVLKRSMADQPLVDFDQAYGRRLARAVPANTPVNASDFL